ncbi:uncharacterized protein LOC110618602 [Manihot esculenta]|uniref:Uncharacterized protein n=4 Tax=Manihot esculenta TaxID=3983 RepID=A0A2C9VNU8_MANES|nr:uncharacterized protein LOC110618602 [Manihot esculenta]XP_021617466.1 uncharacterized protein LOC110618602 [Manihot esculenta]XP_043814224.1 uncharacterized protein LOC110618602 [Manihot esculenta]KAG8651562.1 hypothetical protein MANES_07G142000v8 [Manihot esculenta]KAG8651563.1 hypothetical protein MANES_07G142000v8 [Manihot esculenta]KAG8651564.1 hypothetical protein MANES_07G142000v8 [Manihot esculenta]OAY46415.1 hypothetical protein MANES_07G142000v8 [Manihot esculenta]
MASGTSAQIRLVRCPRCMKILPESLDILVYECGGCGTRLQAKDRKENAKSRTSGLPEIDASEKDKLDHVADTKEDCSLSYETSLHSGAECSSNQNNGRDQNESSNGNGDKLSGFYLPSENENNVSDQSESGEFDSEQLEDENSPNDDKKSGTDKNDPGICDNQQDGGVNLSDEDHNNGSHQNESLTCKIEQHEISNEDFSSNELCHLENGKLSQSPLSRTNSEVDVSDESLLSAAKQKVKAKAEAEAEADAHSESNSTLRRSTKGVPIDTKGSNSIATAQHPAKKNISPDIFSSSPYELLEHPQDSPNHRFDYVMSRDAFENSDFIDPSSELSGSLIDLSKSPTTRSSRAYYDDCASSYEGTDDQLPHRHKHSSKHACRIANCVASDARPRREGFPINTSNNDAQHHFRTSASILPERMHYAIKSNKLDRDELLEPIRHGHPCRNWRRLEKDDYLSQRPFHRRNSLASYESGNPSNHNKFHSSFPTQDKPLYTEQEKMKLLRMFYELQDQLNKASLNDKTIGMAGKDDDIRMNHGHEVFQKESFHNLIYPRFCGRLGEESNWPQQKKYSRVPFSAEVTTSRHQVDHSFCCCPQEWKCTTQFPQPGLHQYKGFPRVHSHLGLYNSYGSCPSSPQRHVDPEFPTYSHGTKSDDQRRRNQELKRSLREKHHLAKRHLRPIAGGAPFITCYCCLKQLQLPADFLLFKRRCHQLKCGACSKVLNFSLQDRIHLLPYTPRTETPPPSEVDEYSYSILRRNFTSTSHISGPYTDSVSCSDDCRLSSYKSCSTVRDPVPPKPFHAIQKNEVQGNMPHVSPEHGEETRKFALNEARNKGKNLVQTDESAGSSSRTSILKKVSSEIEELPAAGRRGGGSPLHRLMGYSSASEVIYG